MSETNNTPDNKGKKEGVSAETEAMFKLMQDQIAAQNELIANLTKEVSESRAASNEPEVVSTDRKPPAYLRIATYEGKPIVDMRLIKKTKLDDNGAHRVIGMEAVCKLAGVDKKITISYGDSENENDYMRLPRVRYELTDIVDSTGASKVDANKVIADGGLTPEKKLSGDNTLVATGKMVKMVVRADVRTYTILVDGKKVQLTQDKIYR